MPIAINGSGPITGITSLNTTVSDTELGYLDGVTSGIQSQINGAGGLVLITSQSFSAASSVSVNNCFSSTYDNYRILVSFIQSVNTDLLMRLRASGSDYTGTGHHYGINGLDSGNIARNKVNNNGNFWFLSVGWTGYYNMATIDVSRPNLTTATSYTLVSQGVSTADASWAGGGALNTSTAYDGFTIYPNSGNVTGTLRVYGYRN